MPRDATRNPELNDDHQSNGGSSEDWFYVHKRILLVAKGRGKCALVAGGDHFVRCWTLRVFRGWRLRVSGAICTGY